jgi:PAS domain-containing protein
MRGAADQWFTCAPPIAPSRGRRLFALKGISQNVTEVARSRDAALWGERRARRLVEEAPFAVAVYDLDLRLRVVSPKFLDVFRTSEDEVIGRSLHDLTQGVRRRFVSAVSSGLVGRDRRPARG